MCPKTHTSTYVEKKKFLIDDPEIKDSNDSEL